MRWVYTKEHLDFLREQFRTLRIRELTVAFNSRFGVDKTVGQIHSTLKNHKIVCGREGGHEKGVSFIFTPEQCRFLRENYSRYTLPELTAELNRIYETAKEVSQVKCYVKNNGIVCGRDGRFQKGSIPWTAGTKGVVKPNSGNFRKGNTPLNRKPVGSERICSKEGFILVKVAETNPYTGFPTRYKHKHVHVWEQHHGPAPEGMVIAFTDGNKLNCSIENLMLVSRSELLILNMHGYKELPNELKPTIRLIAKIQAKGRFRLCPGAGRRKTA